MAARRRESRLGLRGACLGVPVGGFGGAAGRRRWAMLIQRIYQADPLRCPECGGAMKIIAFIEARQGDVIRRVLEHCGLWKDVPRPSPPRAPPEPSGRCPGRRVRCPMPEANWAVTYEVDPEYLEDARRYAIGEDHQPELTWDP